MASSSSNPAKPLKVSGTLDRAIPRASGQLLQDIQSIFEHDKAHVPVSANSAVAHIEYGDAVLTLLAQDVQPLEGNLYYAKVSKDKGAPYIFVPTRGGLDVACFTSYSMKCEVCKGKMEKLKARVEELNADDALSGESDY